MLLQSTIGKTALMIENEMFRGLHTELTRRGQLHVAQAGANVDRRCRWRWHRVGGAIWRGGAAGEEPLPVESASAAP